MGRVEIRAPANAARRGPQSSQRRGGFRRTAPIGASPGLSLRTSAMQPARTIV